MSSPFLSWRQRLTALSAGLALSTPAFAAPLDIHWPEITFTWPPSPPDMLLIGSGIVLVLALGFAITRSSLRKPPQVAAQEDLRWWKNPPPLRDPRDDIDTISLPR
jgi:hypothetical protein